MKTIFEFFHQHKKKLFFFIIAASIFSIAGVAFATAFGDDVHVGGDLYVNGGDFNLGNGTATSTITFPGTGSSTALTFSGVGSSSPNFIFNAGNVGIGMTNPGQKLEVAGNIKMSGGRTKLFYRGDSDSHIGSLAFYSPDSGTTAIITPYNNAGNNIANSQIRFGGFGSFDTSTVGLAVSGSVGIGTASPTYHLSVESGADNQFQVVGKGTGFGGTLLANIYSERTSAGAGGSALLKVGSAFAPNLLFVDDIGRVGIGTASPADNFEIEEASGVPVIVLDHTGETSSFSAISFRDDGSAGGDLRFDQSGTGANYFDFTDANGVSKVKIDIDSGNVGIGTASPGAKLQVNGGDGAVATQGYGLILKATDGANCFRVTVNNAGTLSTASTTCP